MQGAKVQKPKAWVWNLCKHKALTLWLCSLFCFVHSLFLLLLKGYFSVFLILTLPFSSVFSFSPCGEMGSSFEFCIAGITLRVSCWDPIFCFLPKSLVLLNNFSKLNVNAKIRLSRIIYTYIKSNVMYSF